MTPSAHGSWQDAHVQVSAKIDYALRALIELAAHDVVRMTRQELAEAQDIPPRYLEALLGDLRKAGLLFGQRGSSGGYQLARPAAEITVADVARAVDGPLTLVHGQRPEHRTYTGSSEHLHALWIGVRAAMRSVMETVTLADLVSGDLPADLQLLIDDPDAQLAR